MTQLIVSTKLGLDPGLLSLNPLFSHLSFSHLFFPFNNHCKDDLATLKGSIYFADLEILVLFLHLKFLIEGIKRELKIRMHNISVHYRKNNSPCTSDFF